MAKYKVGDKVRILNVTYPSGEPLKECDKWIGKHTIITRILANVAEWQYEAKARDGLPTLYFNDADIRKYNSALDRLKKLLADTETTENK